MLSNGLKIKPQYCQPKMDLSIVNLNWTSLVSSKNEHHNCYPIFCLCRVSHIYHFDITITLLPAWWDVYVYKRWIMACSNWNLHVCTGGLSQQQNREPCIIFRRISYFKIKTSVSNLLFQTMRPLETRCMKQARHFK